MSKDFTPFDNAPIKNVHYRWTILAALGDYLDAGAIVAGAASVSIWVSYFHLSSILLGLIAALSPNAFAAFIGALVAGPLGDRYGRKAIYTYDLIFYIIGTIIVIASVNPFMLILGYIITGIAVGVDVPTSWSLIAEFSPKRGRGRLMSFTNLFWYIGPIVILLLGVGTYSVGVNSFRILFGSLALVALITWLLRRGLIESPRWSAAKGKEENVKKAIEQLGVSSPSTSVTSGIENSKPKLSQFAKGFAFIIPLYIMWGIPAGTFGFFLPFFVKDLGISSATGGDLIQILWFITAIMGVILVPMQLSDKVNRRLLYAISAMVCAIAFAIPIALPVKILAVAAANVILFGFGHGMGLWPITRMWSVELFPTEIRNTAQALVWASMRFAIGVWSIFVPTIVSTIGYSAIASVATAFFVANAIIGGLFGPRAEGKTLEEILKEFYGQKIMQK
ncbi:MFS transporter [Sulfolobus sp. F1]|nr:MFS transporter [Sulfolobus sp. F1]